MHSRTAHALAPLAVGVIFVLVVLGAAAVCPTSSNSAFLRWFRGSANPAQVIPGFVWCAMPGAMPVGAGVVWLIVLRAIRRG